MLNKLFLNRYRYCQILFFVGFIISSSHSGNTFEDWTNGIVNDYLEERIAITDSKTRSIYRYKGAAEDVESRAVCFESSIDTARQVFRGSSNGYDDFIVLNYQENLISPVISLSEILYEMPIKLTNNDPLIMQICYLTENDKRVRSEEMVIQSSGSKLLDPFIGLPDCVPISGIELMFKASADFEVGIISILERQELDRALLDTRTQYIKRPSALTNNLSGSSSINSVKRIDIPSTQSSPQLVTELESEQIVENPVPEPFSILTLGAGVGNFIRNKRKKLLHFYK